jgi:hypothetical protein
MSHIPGQKEFTDATETRVSIFPVKGEQKHGRLIALQSLGFSS